MELVLEPSADGGAAATAARAAAERAGLSFVPERRTPPSPWWRAGLDEALECLPVGRPRPAAYEAARSPRSTRGATRA